MQQGTQVTWNGKAAKITNSAGPSYSNGVPMMRIKYADYRDGYPVTRIEWVRLDELQVVNTDND